MSERDRPPRSARLIDARSATLAIVAAGLLLTLAVNLPGQMSYDSIVQLADGRSGRYHTWHPPIMAWLLGLGDAVLPGTAVYLTAVTTLFFGALAFSIAVLPRVSWATPLLALLACLSPLVVMDQGIVWKDVLFANSLVAGFLLLFVAAGRERDAPERRMLAIAATGLFALAALTRQNGLIAATFGMGALGWLVWRRRAYDAARARLFRAAAVAGGGLVAIVLATAAVNAALDSRAAADDAGSAGQVRLLKFYDLVGAAHRDPAVDLAPLGPDLAAQVRAAEAIYTPQRVDPVAATPAIAEAVGHGAPGLEDAWRGLVLHHPAAWAAHRLDVFRWMIAPPAVGRCLPLYTGVDGPIELMTRLGLKPTWRAQDLRLARYAELFLPTPLYIHAVWAVLATALIGILLWRGSLQDQVLAIMLGSVLAFTASYLLIGCACDHRYLYVLDLATVVALIHAAAGLHIRRRATAAQLRPQRSGIGMSGQRPSTSWRPSP